ncbi:hypothetical protein COBT_000990 [Conglomerata obtusa]
MDDKYSQSQYQAFLNKKKQNTKQSDLDAQILNRASRLEHQTYNESKQAREKLEQSQLKQKATTQELKAQGEKLGNIKSDAKQVNENVKEGHQLTKDIKQAGKLFGWKVPLVGRIKGYFSKEKKMDRDMERKMRNKSVEKLSESSEEEKVNFHKESDVPGQEKTDEELMKIYEGLKGMKREAKDQKHILHKQKGDIADIARYNDNSEHYMNKTNEEMKKL